MTVPTVVCVLRSGKEYTAEHVTALYAGVRKWWPKDSPLRFVVLTDKIISPTPVGIEQRRLQKDWPGWWAKMEVFSGMNDSLGDILYFDLDTIIVGPLDDIARPRPTTLLRDFYHPEKISAGLMYLPLESRPDVYAAWFDMASELQNKLPGDSDYLDLLWRNKVSRWQVELPDQVISFKVHVRQRKGLTIPDNARVVCFHGRPRPWQTPLWFRDK